MSTFQIVQLVAASIVIAVWAAAWCIGLTIDRSVLTSAESLNKPAFAALGIIGGNQIANVAVEVLRKKES